ncbi:Hypothetical predicted protein, partial [Pelobates cultripes]
QQLTLLPLSDHSGKVVPQQHPKPQWAAKIDIAVMVMEIKAYIASEMVVLKTDLSTLVGRMTSMEETVRSLRAKQDTTVAQLHEVSLECAALTAKVEDTARQHNLKVQDTVDAGELPQFIRRLLSTTLTSKQAKGLQLDRLYRLPGHPTNKPSGS